MLTLSSLRRAGFNVRQAKALLELEANAGGGEGGGGGGASTYASLTDVALSGLADGHIPVWDTTTSKWKNEAPAGGGGGGGGSIAAADTLSNSLTGVQRSTGEGGIDETAITWGDILDPWTDEEVAWLTAESGGQAGKLKLAQEGFYNVVMQGFFTFPAETPITYLKTRYTIGSGKAGSYEHLMAPVVNSAGALVCNFLLNFGPIYSNGFALIQPYVRWNEGVNNATTARIAAAVTKLS